MKLWGSGSNSGQTATELMLVIGTVVIGAVASSYTFVPAFQTGVRDLGTDVARILDGDQVRGMFRMGAADTTSSGGYSDERAETNYVPPDEVIEPGRPPALLPADPTLKETLEWMRAWDSWVTWQKTYVGGDFFWNMGMMAIVHMVDLVVQNTIREIAPQYLASGGGVLELPEGEVPLARWEDHQALRNAVLRAHMQIPLAILAESDMTSYMLSNEMESGDYDDGIEGFHYFAHQTEDGQEGYKMLVSSEALSEDTNMVRALTHEHLHAIVAKQRRQGSDPSASFPAGAVPRRWEGDDHALDDPEENFVIAVELALFDPDRFEGLDQPQQLATVQWIHETFDEDLDTLRRQLRS